jgi:hypothetical protein
MWGRRGSDEECQQQATRPHNTQPGDATVPPTRVRGPAVRCADRVPPHAQAGTRARLALNCAVRMVSSEREAAGTAPNIPAGRRLTVEAGVARAASSSAGREQPLSRGRVEGAWRAGASHAAVECRRAVLGSCWRCKKGSSIAAGRQATRAAMPWRGLIFCSTRAAATVLRLATSARPSEAGGMGWLPPVGQYVQQALRPCSYWSLQSGALCAPYVALMRNLQHRCPAGRAPQQRAIASRDSGPGAKTRAGPAHATPEAKAMWVGWLRLDPRNAGLAWLMLFAPPLAAGGP